METEKFVLTEKQAVAKSLVDQGYSLFLTGSGGVGKSVVVRELIDNNTILLAPTGVAAVNIGGATCHSTFGLPVGAVVQSDYMSVPDKVNKLFGNPDNVKRIIIDEIGMVRADFLDLINHRLKTVRRSGEPFGGIQMIFVGDFFQLSPIVSPNEKRIFQEKYNTPYAFGSKAWRILDPQMVELQEVMRQDDARQIKILNSIRKRDEHYKLAVKRINQMSEQEEIEDVITLCTIKKTARALNEYNFRQIDSEPKEYHALIEGEFAEKEYPTEKTLRLKEGCRVVFCANSPEGEFQNGEQGVVQWLGVSSVGVVKDGETTITTVPIQEWKKQDYVSGEKGLSRKEVGTFYQIPLMLGYAITIHKSQGMTLPAYNLDMGWGAFGHGQTYVGLSRCKDLTRVHLTNPLRPKDIIVDEDVIEFYRQFE